MNKSIIFKAMKRILIIKVLFIFLSAHLLFSPLFGNAVWGEKVILTQPNGIKIVGYIYGDEFHHRIETEEGYTIILNEETGAIEYALLENNKLVPSGMVVEAGKTISKMFEWMQANKLMPAGPVLERYLTMPTPDTKPEDLKSEIWIPCQKGTK